MGLAKHLKMIKTLGWLRHPNPPYWVCPFLVFSKSAYCCSIVCSHFSPSKVVTGISCHGCNRRSVCPYICTLYWTEASCSCGCPSFCRTAAYTSSSIRSMLYERSMSCLVVPLVTDLLRGSITFFPFDAILLLANFHRQTKTTMMRHDLSHASFFLSILWRLNVVGKRSCTAYR